MSIDKRTYKTPFKIGSVFFQKKDSLGKVSKVDSRILPLKIDNRQKISPIDQQGNSSACVCFSTCSIAEAYFWRRNGYPINFDALELYSHCKMADGHPNIDGTYLEVGLKCALENGLFGEVRNQEVRLIQNNGRNSSYIDDLKHAIFKYDFVLGGFGVMSTIYDLDAKNYTMQHVGKREGGHCMAIVGYNSVGFIIANSWGKEWGQKGFAICPYDVFAKEFIYGGYIANSLNDLN